MHEAKQGCAGDNQKSRANGELFSVKHLQLFGKFRQHEPSQIGDDSGAIAASAR
ncbi:hypothetical protein [Bradyrhizobium sp.]|uniref:hypothetical protein n=1 Tax=Bradyrhizobium sp. TaxID=376 RepID=UPI0025C69404|nr:hypothetical protein [Bradyrhizobium sp.]